MYPTLRTSSSAEPANSSQDESLTSQGAIPSECSTVWNTSTVARMLAEVEPTDVKAEEEENAVRRNREDAERQAKESGEDKYGQLKSKIGRRQLEAEANAKCELEGKAEQAASEETPQKAKEEESVAAEVKAADDAKATDAAYEVDVAVTSVMAEVDGLESELDIQQTILLPATLEMATPQPSELQRPAPGEFDLGSPQVNRNKELTLIVLFRG